MDKGDTCIHAFPKELVRDVDAFIKWLGTYKGEHTCNPWLQENVHLDVPHSVERRRENLRAYLLARLEKTRYVVIAEAMGYQGGRFTGIAITCERMLLGYHPIVRPYHIVPQDYLDEVERQKDALVGFEALSYQAMRTSRKDSSFPLRETQRSKGFNEPTDTVVWNSILQNKLDPYECILWNIFPFHPYKMGHELTNRTPLPTELAIGYGYTAALLDLIHTWSGARPTVFAVGKKAAETLAGYGIATHTLRHPANGGANQYKEQFRQCIGREKGSDS